MTKDLHKAIIKRSRLTNKFLKDRTETNQKNFYFKEIFVKNSENYKKSYYSNLDIKKLQITTPSEKQ